MSLEDLKEEQEILTSESLCIKAQLKILSTEIARHPRQLKRRKHDIQVSDHALVRYIEKMMGFDVEAIRKKIATPALMNQIRHLGYNGTFLTGECRVVMVDGTIVTIHS